MELEVEDQPQLRALILRSAAAAFAEFGYGGASLRNIGKDAGVTAAALYHHFSNKEDLLLSIVVDAADAMSGLLLSQLSKQGDPAQRLGAMIQSHMLFILEHRAEATVVLEQAHLLSEMSSAVVREKQLAILALYRGCIEEAFQSRGRGRAEANIAAFNVLSIINGLPRWYRDGHKLSRQDALDTAVNFALDGLRLREFA